MSTIRREPTLVYHPEIKRRSLSFTLPDIQAYAGGAHYSASDERFALVREVSTSSAYLATSKVKLVGKRKEVVRDVLELFCSRPTTDIFERSWRTDAQFEDPLGKCSGYNECVAHWFAMHKLFPKSKTLVADVIKSTHGPGEPNQIVIKQKQEYTVWLIGTKQVIKSLVIIDLDENDMIVKLDDKWNASDYPSTFSAYYLARLNTRAMMWFFGTPAGQPHLKQS